MGAGTPAHERALRQPGKYHTNVCGLCGVSSVLSDEHALQNARIRLTNVKPESPMQLWRLPGKPPGNIGVSTFVGAGCGEFIDLMCASVIIFRGLVFGTRLANNTLPGILEPFTSDSSHSKYKYYDSNLTYCQVLFKVFSKNYLKTGLGSVHLSLWGSLGKRCLRLPQLGDLR